MITVKTVVEIQSLGRSAELSMKSLTEANRKENSQIKVNAAKHFLRVMIRWYLKTAVIATYRSMLTEHKLKVVLVVV